MHHRFRYSIVLTFASLVAYCPQMLRAQTPDTSVTQLLAQLDSLRRTNPQEYATVRTTLVTILQMGLGRLGFGPIGFSGVMDSSTAAAIRRFERARRLTITGNPLTRTTLERITADMDRVAKAGQMPSLGLKSFTWGGDWLSAEGPWFLDGEPETYMVVNIYCERPGAECRLAWARLASGFVGRQLQILTETFRVGRWDDVEVISEPLDYQCTRYLLRINRLQETVVMTRSTLSKGDVCKSMDVGDFVTRLIRPEDWPASDSVTYPWDVFNVGPAARSALKAQPPR